MRPFYKPILQNYWEKIAVKITAGRTLFSDDMKILFSESPIIAGPSKCTTKHLSCHFIKLLSTIKDGVVRYCNIKPSRNMCQQHVNSEELNNFVVIT